MECFLTFTCSTHHDFCNDDIETCERDTSRTDKRFCLNYDIKLFDNVLKKPAYLLTYSTWSVLKNVNSYI